VAGSVTGTCGGTLSGNTFTTNAVTAGCTVVASFVAKSNQTITFADLSNKILGDADFNISATASSNLTVSFSSQTPTVCTVAGTSVHLVAAGTCTIRASQAGNSTYNAAADVDRSFTVSPVAVNGSCGNDNDATLTSQPTNLCTVGTASSVTTGNSSYNWSCTGLYSGSTANCSATRHYSVTSSVNGGNGTISASQTVAYQATPSFTLTPNSGYVAGSVTGTCGGTLSGNTFTTNAVVAGCSVIASFINDASGGGTDSDNDGVKDADDQAPNNPNVATPDDQQGNPVTLETNHAFQNIEIVSASTLPSTGKPDESNYQFPKGAIEYTVVGVPNGGTITVTITFASTIPTGSKVYKISSTGGYQLFPNAVINGNQVTLTLTDGGLGDDDGVVNGQIKDPVAIAEPANNTTTTTAGSGGGGGSVSLAWLLFALMIYVLRYRNQRGMYW
ncbi:MAG TPA: hypothetical protein PLE99_02605, partial [Candidatus Thiothrix moscowensis]|nr:hypothetical protein [Candidatus Thiothrix moscowensis]